MIRTVASTIVERPMLIRDGATPSTHSLVENHIRELPYMIECFRNAIVSVSRESKWGKLALLRNRVPVEIFSLIQPFLIMKGEQDFYPSVADNRVPHRKYLIIESKLYRMEIVNADALGDIRRYIENLQDFKQDTKRNSWHLWELKKYHRARTDFLKYVLHLHYLETGVERDEYNMEHVLRYWF
jgi:hypothetical protein